MARQLSFSRIQLWHMVPIAALLHGALLYLPIQAGTNSAQTPKATPPAVKVATLPAPTPAFPKPSPIAQPSSPPIVKPSLPPVVQPQRTIVVQPPIQPPIVPQPIAQTPPQPAPSPVGQPSPVPSPTPTTAPNSPPPKELNTTSDMLTKLGGQPCGLGCFQVADKTLGDVMSEFEQQFRNQPQEIRDSNTEELLGYIVTNRKGEAEYIYYTSQANPNQPSLVHSFRTLSQYITDRAQLNAALGVM